MKIAAEQLTPARRNGFDNLDPSVLDIHKYSNVPVVTDINVFRSFLIHEGPERNYAPTLRLDGEISRAHIEAELPYDIREFSSREGHGRTASVFYRFDRDQLGELAHRGYFEEGFTVPSALSQQTISIPQRADVWIIGPHGDIDFPLVFVDYTEAELLETSLENSGIDFVENFAPVVEPIAEQQVQVESEREAENSYVEHDILEKYNLEQIAERSRQSQSSRALLMGDAEPENVPHITDEQEVEVTSSFDDELAQAADRLKETVVTEEGEVTNENGTVVEDEEFAQEEEEEQMIDQAVQGIVIEENTSNIDDGFVDDWNSRSHEPSSHQTRELPSKNDVEFGE